MTRFSKILAVLCLLAVIAGFLFLGAVANLVGRLGEGGGPRESRPHLTVLRIEGAIMGSETYLESIRRISRDKACKGLLVRVDSPGGAVGSSQEIRAALINLKSKGLPVVVSQGNVAASGGYYVSLAGDRIFSNPGTLTGSIGVILQFPVAEKLLDKIGVDLKTIKSGDLKDAGNFARPPTPGEMRYLQKVIDNTYGQFIDDVLASRKIAREDLLPIADGRVMTGLQALGYGLVDTLGGYREAEHYLAGLAKIDGEPILVQEPPERSRLEELFGSRGEQSLASLVQTARQWLPEPRVGAFFLWR